MTGKAGKEKAEIEKEIYATTGQPDSKQDPQEDIIIDRSLRMGGDRPFWMDLMVIIGVYVVLFFISSLVGYIMASLTGVSTSLRVLIQAVIQLPASIAFAVWLLRKRGMKRPILSFSFKSANPTMILWGVLLLAATSIVIEPLLLLFPAQYMDGMRNYVLEGGGLTMFTTVLLIPVLEEMFFRGIIQESTSRTYGAMTGIMLSSVIFALAHGSPQQMINAFFCGIILAYIYYRTKSLIPVIFMHIINNALSYIMTMMFPENTVFTFRQLIHSDVWYYIVYGISAALFVFALVNLGINLKKNDSKLNSLGK